MLAGSVEHRTVDKTTLVVHKHLVISLGHFTITHIEHLVLQSAGQHFHTVILGILGQELSSGVAVRAPQLLFLGSLVGNLLLLEIGFGIGLLEDRSVLQQCIGETLVEQ